MDDDAPITTFSRTETRVARKDHVKHPCICGLPIKKGEPYRRTFAIVDGEREILKEGLHAHTWDMNDMVDPADEHYGDEDYTDGPIEFFDDDIPY